MKIYVITKGCYSDYHICAVADDLDKAKKLQKLFTDKLYDAQIEEFDTMQFEYEIERGYKHYRCNISKYGNITIYDIGIMKNPNTELKVMDNKSMYCTVVAKDEEHAKKIFTDKIAEYKARKENLI